MYADSLKSPNRFLNAEIAVTVERYVMIFSAVDSISIVFLFSPKNCLRELVVQWSGRSPTSLTTWTFPMVQFQETKRSTGTKTYFTSLNLSWKSRLRVLSASSDACIVQALHASQRTDAVFDNSQARSSIWVTVGVREARMRRNETVLREC